MSRAERRLHGQIGQPGWRLDSVRVPVSCPVRAKDPKMSTWEIGCVARRSSSLNDDISR